MLKIIRIYLPLLLLLTNNISYGQSDTLLLDEVIIDKKSVDINYSDSIIGTYIYTGKKNEIIDITATNANIAEKTGRQLFAKVPGFFVYDMDGSGNQINVSTRGLDAHRGWEFNIRKDGIQTNSDIYGYPASHYSIPMESISSVQLIRGTGSLQYGAQFGGMINYITKFPDTTKKAGFESISTIGTFGLVSTYNSIGGKLGKFVYNAYVYKKESDGYRRNAHTTSDAEMISLIYMPVKKLVIRGEWARSNYLYKIPGPLTDNMFNSDPRQSTRSRNYFNPSINVPSLAIDWILNEHRRLYFASSAVLGSRNSVMFDKPATVADTINPATLQYNNRQVDIDNFNSHTTELRFLNQYRFISSRYSTLVMGILYMSNNMRRRQLGKGTTGSDFDLTLVQPGWGRDLHFKTQNIAFFIENNFKVSEKLSLNAGLRVESGQSNLSGKISYLPEERIPNTINHHFPLFGFGVDYKRNSWSDFYVGWSQAYRPVILKDIIPTSTYEFSDNHLKDAYGSNLEIGYRGKRKYLKWDFSYFHMQYNNRLGKLSFSDNSGSFYILNTNIGNSVTNGVEFFMETDYTIKNIELSLFISTSYMDARYRNAIVRLGNANININGNKVESVPNWISRNGITLKIKKSSLTILYSYVSKTFADPFNTILHSSNGAVGIVPAYGILDMNSTIRLTEKLNVRLSFNNLMNKQYFTKRPLFYPGPGVWSSDGRNFNISVGIKI